MNIFDQIRSADRAKQRALASLHTELGYDSAQALAHAILEAAGSRSVGPWGVTPLPASKVAKSAGRGRGRRLSDATRDAIKAALKAGAKGTDVAKQFGVSYPTIHIIKTDLGLVKARAK